MTGSFALPWWALAAGFGLAEVAVVHYDFRRESQSFSMNELPLVFGLFFATPRDLVLATVVGSGVALVAHRRQLGLKLLFNVGHFALGACLAVVIFDAIVEGERAFEPTSWFAVLLATLAASVLSTSAIFTAILLAERRFHLGKLPEQVSLAFLATLGSASLGLVGVGAAWNEPAAALLLAVPVGTFFLAYRGYVLKQQERDSLVFLYRSARSLDEAADVASGVGALLGRACDMFRAELAQLAVLAAHEADVALVVTARGENVHTAEGLSLDGVDAALRRALSSTDSFVLTYDPAVIGPNGYPVRTVMAVPLRVGAQTRGALLVENRLGANGTFKSSDVRLLETLAAQVGVSLENGRLSRTLVETALRAERDRHNALVLQRGILPPPLPRVPGASVAVRYVPVAVGQEVGGDWYDVMLLPGGDVGVAIGDVVGHDLEAAARMGQARSALRAYATEGHSPAALMTRLNHLLTQTDPDFMGTCCYLQFNPREHQVTLVSAGHPPPLMIDPSVPSAETRACLVELDPNMPLGVEEDTTYTQRTVTMPEGHILVLYTDGLVESRTLSLEAGLARIARVPRQHDGSDLEALAERFVDHAAADQAGDDLTLLLLRHDPEPAASLG